MTYKKLGDLFAGIICLGFAIGGVFLFDKSEFLTWIVIAFFGAGGFLLLFRYFNPNNKNVTRKENDSKIMSDKDFLEFYNSDGIFLYRTDGFSLSQNEKTTEITWNEIIKMTGFKIDLYTTDEICLHVEVDNGKSFDITENTEGWHQFIKKIKEQFPTVNPTWEIDISVPAFERMETDIYSRGN